MKKSEITLDKFMPEHNMVVGDDICIKGQDGKLIPIYFNNEKYFTREDSNCSLDIKDNDFLRECETYVRSRGDLKFGYWTSPYNMGIYMDRVYWGSEDWGKVDTLKIPYNSNLKLVIKNGLTETDLDKLIAKCNMTGGYTTRTKWSLSIRIYPFAIVQQYYRKKYNIYDNYGYSV
jgi:hypothetical protein